MTATHAPRPSRRTVRIAPAALALLVAGCASATPSASSEETTHADDSSSPAATAAPAEQATTAAPPPSDEAPIATRKARFRGYSLALDVYPLHRQGATLVMNTRMRVLDTPAKTDATDLWDVLRNEKWPAEKSVTAKMDSLGDTAGFMLVDEASGVAHLPAGVDGTAACPSRTDVQLAAGDELWISCLFGAPSGSQSELTITATTFGSFTHVPVR